MLKYQNRAANYSIPVPEENAGEQRPPHAGTMRLWVESRPTDSVWHRGSNAGGCKSFADRDFWRGAAVVAAFSRAAVEIKIGGKANKPNIMPVTGSFFSLMQSY